MALSMETTESQAGSIGQGIAKTREFRPNSHDLAIDTYGVYGIEVLMVKVESLV